jgi:hypothetical protein
LSDKCELDGKILYVSEALDLRDRAGRRRYPAFKCIECGELVQPMGGQLQRFEHRRGTDSPNCSKRSKKRS